jgi:hypothetical protein
MCQANISEKCEPILLFPGECSSCYTERMHRATLTERKSLSQVYIEGFADGARAAGLCPDEINNLIPEKVPYS